MRVGGVGWGVEEGYVLEHDGLGSQTEASKTPGHPWTPKDQGRPRGHTACKSGLESLHPLLSTAPPAAPLPPRVPALPHPLQCILHRFPNHLCNPLRLGLDEEVVSAARGRLDGGVADVNAAIEGLEALRGQLEAEERDSWLAAQEVK